LAFKLENKTENVFPGYYKKKWTPRRQPQKWTPLVLESFGTALKSGRRAAPARNVRPNIVSRLPEKSASPAEMNSMLVTADQIGDEFTVKGAHYYRGQPGDHLGLQVKKQD
jgi:hypothetical protein